MKIRVDNVEDEAKSYNNAFRILLNVNSSSTYEVLVNKCKVKYFKKELKKNSQRKLKSRLPSMRNRDNPLMFLRKEVYLQKKRGMMFVFSMIMANFARLFLRKDGQNIFNKEGENIFNKE